MNGPSIAELYEAGKLTTRAYRALKADDVTRLADLCSWSENELLRVPNVGRVSVAQIKQVKADHGLALKR